MTLHELQPRGPAAAERLARMRRRWREVSRRASRAERGRRQAARGGVLAALVVSSACIGAAAFAVAETLIARVLWP